MAMAEDILGFWFAESPTDGTALSARMARWFGHDETFDRTIASRFGDDIERAGRGEFDAWKRAARGRLALIVLLDQMARNAHRGSARAYAFDATATALCLEGLAARADLELAPIERLFFYLPLLHSERLSDQRRSVECFERLRTEAPSQQTRDFAAWAALARRHRAIIALFGRFPHRNAVFDRESSVKEATFLAIRVLRERAILNARRLGRWLASG